MEIYPEQIRTLDPYAEYYSNNVNRLTNMVSNNENCIINSDQIDVAITTAFSPPLLTVSTGACIKDNVFIRFTESFDVNMTYRDFYYDNKTPFDEGGYYYIVIDYSYVKCRPAPQAAIKIIKPSDRSGYYPDSLIFLKCVLVELVSSVLQITHVYNYDPENITNRRITSKSFAETIPTLPSYIEGDAGRIIYAGNNGKAYIGLSDSWLEIGSGGVGSGYSGYSGHSGVDGIDGHKGTSGYSGSRTGISGYSGKRGTSGYSGASPIYWTDSLLNGDMEIWTDGATFPPDHWALDSAHGGSVEREETIKYSGNYSAKLSVSPSGTYSEIYQYIHESLGMDYWRGKIVTFSVWVWASIPSSVYVQVLDGVDPGGKSPYHPGDSAWHNLSVTFTIDPTATSVVCIFSTQGVSNVAYFDAARLGSDVGIPGISGYSGVKGDQGERGVRGYSGYAGFTRTSSGYIYPTTLTDNLGLGTATPLSKLSVHGGVHIGGDSDPGSGNLLVDGWVCGLCKEIITPISTVLVPSDVSGNMFNNYGQVADVTIALPACSSGLSFIVVLGTTVSKFFHILPNVVDSIYLGGTTTGDGKFVGISSAVKGSVISFVAFRTGVSSYDWFATIINGSWYNEA